MLVSFSSPVFAHNRSEHDEDIEYILFGSRNYNTGNVGKLFPIPTARPMAHSIRQKFIIVFQGIVLSIKQVLNIIGHCHEMALRKCGEQRKQKNEECC